MPFILIMTLQSLPVYSQNFFFIIFFKNTNN